MPPRDWVFRIEDILRAVESIRAYTDDMDFESFARDRRTVDAVVRNLTVIGEASAHIPAAVCRAHPELPWGDMRAMRNLVVHEYFGVSDRIIWNTIRDDLPPLVEPLRALRHSIDA